MTPDPRRFRRPSVDRDVDDELAFHLAMRAELYEASGLDAQTARDAALLRFGDVDDVRTRCITIGHERERRMRRLELWSALRQHTRHALRRLRAAPGFAAAVLLMLTLGIGATTTVFGVVDGVLLRPLPFPDPERLVALSHSIALSGLTSVEQSDGSFLLYQRHATASFEHMGAYQLRDVNLGVPAGDGGAAERVPAAAVSAGLFPTLGVPAARGRALRPDDDRSGAPPVVVISAALWQRRFGGDPAVVGRRLVVDGVAREVVGVMPARFAYPAAATALWLPLALDPAQASPGSFNFQAIGRLRPEVAPAAAAAEMARFLPRLLDEFPVPDIPRDLFAQAQLKPLVRPLRDAIVGDVGDLLWVLLGAVGLLLAVACANVASLFVVRAEGGQRDLAVRVALGAGRGPVLAQYLGEALLLALGGGALGVAAALVGVRALRALPGVVELPRLAEVGVDARVLLFAALTSTLGAVAVSLLPVLRARHVTPSVALRGSSRSATAGRERQRARSALVVAQVALALVLVAGSALMARSFARLRDVRPGFDARGVLTLRVALPEATYGDFGAVLRFYERIADAAAALPGVRGVAVADRLPLGEGDDNATVLQIEDRPARPDALPPDHPAMLASADYFAVMGIPLLAGRTLSRVDAARPPAEVVVSRAFAERYWKGGSALGKRVRPTLNGPWLTIVGVVGDVHMRSLARPAEGLVYFPLVTADGPDVSRGVAIVVRTTGDPLALAPAVRAIVRRLDPGVPTYAEQPMTAIVAGDAAQTRFVMIALGVASLVALAIGAVGLYGVIAYGVTLRRREIGVRIALGASVRDVSRLVARHGVALGVLGVVAGLAASLIATRFLRGLLYGVSPTDPVVLAGTCAVLLAVAGVASWLPARRAAAVDPAEALRRD